MTLSRALVQPLIDSAFREDLGRAGDITTDAIVPLDARATAYLVARTTGCLAGLDVARWVFETVDPEIEWQAHRVDGDRVEPDEKLATVFGSARAVLTAERVALNLIGRLSGIATATSEMVAAVRGTGATIVCTRKTTPGLRLLEKYAVRVGGGRNHRFGLDDAVLIKDNHIVLAGGIEVAIERARASVGHLVKVEVEVDTLDQLEKALAVGVDVVMLDNFSLEALETGTRLAREAGVVSEASGGVTGETVTDIARTGVDLISVGWLTHSAPSLDVGLDME